jgi:hypothetical protein
VGGERKSRRRLAFSEERIFEDRLVPLAGMGNDWPEEVPDWQQFPLEAFRVREKLVAFSAIRI